MADMDDQRLAEFLSGTPAAAIVTVDASGRPVLELTPFYFDGSHIYFVLPRGFRSRCQRYYAGVLVRVRPGRAALVHDHRRHGRKARHFQLGASIPGLCQGQSSQGCMVDNVRIQTIHSPPHNIRRQANPAAGCGRRTSIHRAPALGRAEIATLVDGNAHKPMNLSTLTLGQGRQ